MAFFTIEERGGELVNGQGNNGAKSRDA